MDVYQMRNIINQIPVSLLYIAQALTVLSIAYFSLHLYSYDLRVPLSYSGDSVVILMYIKGLIQDGWPTIISHLSAPFTYPGAAFPMLTSVDWLIIKILSVFTAEPGYLLNGFWIFTLIFSAWSATYAAYQMGLSRALSFVSGVLYAFLPFALLRNVAHMNLVYYFVPLLCLLAVIIIGRGAGIRQVKQATIVGLVACALQGFDYVYYSFFAVLLFGVATLISYTRGGGYKQIKLPLLAIIIVTLSTVINMIPAMQSWDQDGSPPGMNYKRVQEAEYYGAKLRKMIAPHPDNPIIPLAIWGQEDILANFPNENENTSTRLGIYGAFGLLIVLAISLRIVRSEIVVLPILSNLSLFTFLVITVGGLGAVINLLTVPDIRCYNRFSVFLGFFCIVAMSLYGEELHRKISSKLSRVLFYVFLFSIAIISLHDQLLDNKGIVNRQKDDALQAKQQRELVSKIEGSFVEGSKIFQFPITDYPLDAGLNRMGVYAHGQPYLWSSHLNWSWPSFSQRHRSWQDKIPSLKDDALVKYLVLSMFDLVWVDRYGYKDNGVELITMLVRNGAQEQFAGYNNRYAILDLRDYKKQLIRSIGQAQFETESKAVLNTVSVDWQEGFYGVEQNPEGHLFRWAQNKAKMVLRNPGESPLTVCISFDIASRAEGHIQLDGADLPVKLKASTIPQSIRIPLNLAAGEVKTLEFSTGLPLVDAPGDSRKLYFYVMDFDFSVNRYIANRGISCSALDK